MKDIPVGAKGQFVLVVRPEHLANQFKDSALPPVLATPVMIMVMENAALNAIKAYLEPGESAVGTRRHRASGADTSWRPRRRRGRGVAGRWAARGIHRPRDGSRRDDLRRDA